MDTDNSRGVTVIPPTPSSLLAALEEIHRTKIDDLALGFIPEDFPQMDIASAYRVAMSYGLSDERMSNTWYKGGDILGRCKYNSARTQRAKAHNKKRKKKCKR